MAMAFDVSKYYNERDFSDVTIKFGDREINCHKMILCAGSNYFKALCGPISRFQEGGQGAVELKDDEDPNAVEAVLLCLYGIDYNERLKSKRKDPVFHLNVCITAAKYLVPKLEAKAIYNLHLILDTATMKRNPVLSLVHGHIKYGGEDYQLNNLFKDLIARNVCQLMTPSEFRHLLDVALRLLKFVVDKIELASSLEEKTFTNCVKCDSLYGQQVTFCELCELRLRSGVGSFTKRLKRRRCGSSVARVLSAVHGTKDMRVRCAEDVCMG